MLFPAFGEGMNLAELLEDKMYRSTSNKNDANSKDRLCIFSLCEVFVHCQILGFSSCIVWPYDLYQCIPSITNIFIPLL